MIDNSALRSTIFKHLDGLVIAPVAYSLKKRGVMSHIFDKREVSLAELTAEFKANEGYLNVALRVLSSQGFLKYEINNGTDEIRLSLTDKSEITFPLFDLYEDVVDLLNHSLPLHSHLFEDTSFERLIVIFEK